VTAGIGVSVRVAAVWCDFGGVLTSSVLEATARFVRSTGIPEDVLMAAVDLVADGFGRTMFEPLELGLISQRDWGARVAAALAPDWTSEIDLRRLGDHFYAGRTAKPALLQELARIRADGIRVGMLTNSVREWEPLRHALLPEAADVFERCIASYEVGYRKPEPAIYKMAERVFGLIGERCLLVDDTEANCDAARELGWTAIHHRSTATTVAALNALV
jgi:putative hydrolase of the HAD superfamily